MPQQQEASFSDALKTLLSQYKDLGLAPTKKQYLYPRVRWQQLMDQQRKAINASLGQQVGRNLSMLAGSGLLSGANLQGLVASAGQERARLEAGIRDPIAALAAQWGFADWQQHQQNRQARQGAYGSIFGGLAGAFLSGLGGGLGGGLGNNRWIPSSLSNFQNPMGIGAWEAFGEG